MLRSAHDPQILNTHSEFPPDTRSSHHHGRWDLQWDGDEISEISLDGVTMLESVRPMLRDRNWGTIPPSLVHQTLSPGRRSSPDSKRVLESSYSFPEGAARASLSVRIHEETLRIRFELDATADVMTNRTGLTVLLPRSMVGDDAVVTTTAGNRRDFRFPVAVSPWQPLFDIRALSLDHGGVRASVTFSGDVFEMEDQRNWCDASYKIYNRPLDLPFPYRIAAGEKIVQEISIVADSPVPRTDETRPASATGAAGPCPLGALLSATAPTVLPRISIGASTTYRSSPGAPVSSADGISYLTVEVSDRFDMDRPLAHAAREAHDAGLPIDLRLNATPTIDIDAVLAALDAAGATLGRIGIVSADTHVTTEPLWAKLREATRGRHVDLVAGSRTHFTELNRQIHVLPAGVRHLSFGYSPQMHMTETWHIVESVAALGDSLRSARQLVPSADILLGPVSLRPRVNAVATQVDQVDLADDDGYGAHRVPGSTDPRQHTPWAAAWVGAVLAEAASEHVAEVSLMEMVGPRGIVPTVGASTPLSCLLKLLGGWCGRTVRVISGFAGAGTAVISQGEDAVIVNARQQGITVTAGADSTHPMRVPAGTIVTTGSPDGGRAEGTAGL